jgi:hypothetical protein
MIIWEQMVRDNFNSVCLSSFYSYVALYFWGWHKQWDAKTQRRRIIQSKQKIKVDLASFMNTGINEIANVTMVANSGAPSSEMVWRIEQKEFGHNVTSST